MEYLIVGEIGKGEIVEKKSRFIAHIFPVETEQEALEIIEAVKKKYWDARHNCYAFVVGKNNETQRFSDDGEPQGTAGKPILETLLNGNYRNTLIIVTRYFGGTLLGTGGLVRAYGQSSKAGLDNTKKYNVCDGTEVDVQVDYNSIGKIKYIVANMNIKVVDEQYGQDVTMKLDMKTEAFSSLKEQITDATGGKAVFSNEHEIEYKEEI